MKRKNEKIHVCVEQVESSGNKQEVAADSRVKNETDRIFLILNCDKSNRCILFMSEEGGLCSCLSGFKLSQ